MNGGVDGGADGGIDGGVDDGRGREKEKLSGSFSDVLFLIVVLVVDVVFVRMTEADVYLQTLSLPHSDPGTQPVRIMSEGMSDLVDD